MLNISQFLRYKYSENETGHNFRLNHLASKFSGLYTSKETVVNAYHRNLLSSVWHSKYAVTIISIHNTGLLQWCN